MTIVDVVPLGTVGTVLPALLATAFPFHLAIDADGRVAAVGASLLRAAPGLAVGTRVHDHIQVLSPVGLQLGPESVVGNERSLVLLTALDGRLTLRGQLSAFGGSAVFLGSPWITDPAQLAPLGLSLADFAVHDPVADFLMLLQAQTASLADAERLGARLAEAAAAQSELVAAERRLAAELDAIPDLTLRLDEDAMILEVRPARDGQLAVPAVYLVGTSATQLFPSWETGLCAALAQALSTGRTQALAFEQPVEGARVGHFEARLTRSGANEVLVLVRDVTDRRELEHQLTRQAYTDALTGLANRALLDERISAAVATFEEKVAAGQVGAAPPALLLIDLDDFKTVNDTLGHPAGDRLLEVIGGRLREHSRPEDTVARLGGDEFALLLPAGLAAELVGGLGDRLLGALGKPVDLDGRQVHPRASIGIASAEPGAGSATLLRDADLAMYAAKNAGKHRWATFHADLHARTLDQLALESDLRTALDHAVDPFAPGASGGTLDVHYQPVVDLRTGAVRGVEALLRWTHPERGPVPPATFIPLAERSGLIGPLGAWVLQRACGQAVGWLRDRPADAPFFLSVNLSARQLDLPDLDATVRAALDATGFPAEQLVLEITETALLDQPEEVLRPLAELRGAGVRLALDDFGTGYSSLSRLSQLPVDILKIDRSFISQVADGGADTAVARTIVELGRALRLTVVAEGIETAEQRDQLQELGCPLGQGFGLGRPAPAMQTGLLLGWTHDAGIASAREGTPWPS